METHKRLVLLIMNMATAGILWGFAIVNYLNQDETLVLQARAVRVFFPFFGMVSIVTAVKLLVAPIRRGQQ